MAKRVKLWADGTSAGRKNRMKTLLDQTGRIRVPDLVQRQLGVKVGDELAWEEEGGRWFVKPGRPAAATSEVEPAAAAEEDLDWEELDYTSVPLRSAGSFVVRFECRGALKPMIHNLEDE